MNLIRGYDAGELRINDRILRTALILSASVLIEQPELHALDGLGSDLIERVLQMSPDIVLLGTGNRQIFPQASFGARFLRAGIGFDVMDTGAACRTYNVLVGEQRNVVAILLP